MKRPPAKPLSSPDGRMKEYAFGEDRVLGVLCEPLRLCAKSFFFRFRVNLPNHA